MIGLLLEKTISQMNFFELMLYVWGLIGKTPSFISWFLYLLFVLIALSLVAVVVSLFRFIFKKIRG